MRQTLTAGDDSPTPQTLPDSRPTTYHRPRSGPRPPALLAVVPHLLGFVPQASLVVIGTAPPRDRIKVTLRYDLPDPPGAGVAADIAAHAVGVARLAAADRDDGGRLRTRSPGRPGRGRAARRGAAGRDRRCATSCGSRTAATGPTACARRGLLPGRGHAVRSSRASRRGRHGRRRESRCWPTGPRWRPGSRRSAASPRSPCARPPAGPNGTSPSCSPRSASPPASAPRGR